MLYNNLDKVNKMFRIKYLLCNVIYIMLLTNSLFRREFVILFKLDKRNGMMSSNKISPANNPIRLNLV